MKIISDYNPSEERLWYLRRSKTGTIVTAILSFLLIGITLITDMPWEAKLEISTFILAIAIISVAMYIRKKTKQ
jgi:hypothetical protein